MSTPLLLSSHASSLFVSSSSIANITQLRTDYPPPLHSTSSASILASSIRESDNSLYGGIIPDFNHFDSFLSMNNSYFACNRNTTYKETQIENAKAASFNSDTFDSCTAETDDGGGIRQTIAKELTIIECKFLKCSSKQGSGGGIASIGNVKIERSVFLDCSAAVNGGAYFALQAPEMPSTIQKSIFRWCSSKDSGGTLFFSSSGRHFPHNISISSCAFDESQAGVGGGAIMSTVAPFSVSFSSFVGSKAAFGGGIDIARVFDAQHINIRGLLFSECEATQNGACIAVLTAGTPWIVARSVIDCMTTAQADDISGIIYYSSRTDPVFTECTVTLTTLVSQVEVKPGQRDNFACWNDQHPCSTISRAIQRVPSTQKEIFHVVVEAGQYEEWGWAVDGRNLSVTGAIPSQFSNVGTNTPNGVTKIECRPSALTESQTAYISSNEAFIKITTGWLTLAYLQFTFVRSSELTDQSIASFAQLMCPANRELSETPSLIMSVCTLSTTSATLSKNFIVADSSNVTMFKCEITSIASTNALVSLLGIDSSLTLMSSLVSDCTVSVGSLFEIFLPETTTETETMKVTITDTRIKRDDVGNTYLPLILTTFDKADETLDKEKPIVCTVKIISSHLIINGIIRPATGYGHMVVLERTAATFIDSTFSGSGELPPTRAESEGGLTASGDRAGDVICIWNSALVCLVDSDSNIERALFCNSTVGSLGVVGGKCVVTSATFSNNTIASQPVEFGDMRRNVFCKMEAALTLQAVQVDEFSTIDHTVISNNLWIFNEDCEVTTKKGSMPDSLYFTPSLTTATWKTLNTTHSRVTLAGSNIFPCFMYLEILDQKATMADEFALTDHPNSKKVTFIVEATDLKFPLRNSQCRLTYPLGLEGMDPHFWTKEKMGRTPLIPLVVDSEQKSKIAQTIMVLVPVLVVSCVICVVLFTCGIALRKWEQRRDRKKADNSVETDSLIPPIRQSGKIRKFQYATQRV